MFTIKLAWPVKQLWPNPPVHWRSKIGPTKQARNDASAALVAVGGKGTGEKWKRASLGFVFHPKTKRTPDRTNCAASMKAVEDGIADALFMNDKDFVCTYEIGEPVKGGLVVVTIKEMEE